MQEINFGEKIDYEVFLQRFIGNHWINKVIQDGVAIQEGTALLNIVETSNGEFLLFQTECDQKRTNINAIIDPKKATFSCNSENKLLGVSISDAPEGHLKELCFVFEREPGEV